MLTLIPALLLLAAPQAKPTFDEIEALKHKAYRSLADYREVVEIDVRGGDQRQKLTIAQRIQGSKQRVVAMVNGQKYMESGHNGVSGWAITHPSKEYKIWQTANTNFTSPYIRPDHTKAPIGDFNFLFDNGYNIRFTANPPFKVISISMATFQNAPARKIVSQATIEAGKRYVKVTQWFYADKWLLKGFDIEGKGRQSGVFKASGRVKESSFAAQSTPGQFRLDPKLVRGYRLIKD